MPELPEVETTRRGLAPAVERQRIRRAVVRHRGLRLPVPRGLERRLAGARVAALWRRGKYLLFDCGDGTLILHLGMSGRLWLVDRRRRRKSTITSTSCSTTAAWCACATRAVSAWCCGRPAIRCSTRCWQPSARNR